MIDACLPTVQNGRETSKSRTLPDKKHDLLHQHNKHKPSSFPPAAIPLVHSPILHNQTPSVRNLTLFIGLDKPFPSAHPIDMNTSKTPYAVQAFSAHKDPAKPGRKCRSRRSSLPRRHFPVVPRHHKTMSSHSVVAGKHDPGPAIASFLPFPAYACCVTETQIFLGRFPLFGPSLRGHCKCTCRDSRAV